jgi:hypothetical protein
MAMFRAVRVELQALAARFDPALVDLRTASEIREDATAIKNMAAAIEARAMARIAETGTWRESGDRSAAEAMARQSGTTVKDV